MTTKRKLLGLMGGAALSPLPAFASRAAGREAGPGAAYFSNAVLLSHDGRKLRFYDDLLKGKIVLISMMYTACTGICPGSTANLLRVQQALGSRVGRDIFMYSLSLQPQFDTPAALNAYVQRYGIGPGWTFLTGKPAEVDNIRRKLGFYSTDPVEDADIGQHTGMVRVGNLVLDRWSMVPAMTAPKHIVRSVLQI